MVEFALVLPIFLLLIVGVLYGAIAFVTYQAVAHAAQRGADAAIVVDSGVPDYAEVVGQRVDAAVSKALAFLPGPAPDIQTRPDCDAVTSEDMSEPPTSVFCVYRSGSVGGQQVTVRLAPSFASLWPAFPVSALLPLPIYVRATGTAVAARPANAS